jgi:hypothetical protein
MKLSAKLPPADEGAKLMRFEIVRGQRGVRTLLGVADGMGAVQARMAAARPRISRDAKRVISMGDDCVSPWPHDALSCGGGS